MFNLTLNKEILILIGDVTIAATVQFVVANLLMTSTFNIIHFTKQQTTLQHASDRLSNYVKISLICTIALTLLFYAKKDIIGAIISLIINILMIISIYISYTEAFKISAKNHNLSYPDFNLF